MGYLSRLSSAILEQLKIAMKEMSNKMKVMVTTTKTLLSLSKSVKCLFYQMMSVGSDASSILMLDPKN